MSCRAARLLPPAARRVSPLPAGRLGPAGPMGPMGRLGPHGPHLPHGIHGSHGFPWAPWAPIGPQQPMKAWFDCLGRITWDPPDCFGHSHIYSFIYIYIYIFIYIYVHISEVVVVSPTGKSFRVVRACVCARGGSLVRSGVKTVGLPRPFSLFPQWGFPFPLRGYVSLSL